MAMATCTDRPRFPAPTFTRSRDDERDDIAQGIHDQANAVIALLAPYGITAATLTALQTRIDALSVGVRKPEDGKR